MSNLASNPFNITPEKAAQAVRELSNIMGCSFEVAWKKYTHDAIKAAVDWEDVKELL